VTAAPRPGPRLHATVSLVVVGLALAGVAVTGYLWIARPGTWETHEVVTHLYFVPVVLAFGLVGAAVLGRVPGHPVGWLFASIGVVGGVNGLAAPWGAMDLVGSAFIEDLAALGSAVTLGLLALSLLLFPTGRPVAPGWRWVVRGVALQMVMAASVTLLDPVPGWARPLDSVGSFVVGMLLLAVGVASLAVRWRRGSGVERQQLTWLVLAGLLFGLEVLIGLVTTAMDDRTTSTVGEYVGNAIFGLTLLSVPVAMGLAITRYRLYDVDRVVSRALTFGTLASGVVVVYATGLAVLAGTVVAESAGATAAGLVLAALVAAVVVPVRTWLLDRSERWVYGARADRYDTMRALAADLARTAAPDAVLTRVAEAASLATRARGARLTLAPAGAVPREATWGRPPDPADSSPGPEVPLVVDGELVGRLVLADASGRPSDERLMRDVVDLALPAVHNLVAVGRLEALGEELTRQNVELERSRALVARAARDERAAIRQVVRHELRPRLDDLLAALPTLPAADHAVLRADYEDLAGRSRRLAADIRALAHAVLPPLLVDRGLLPALRALAREVPLDVHLDAGTVAEDDRLPPEVETTVYLACREGLRMLSAAAVLRLDRTAGHLQFILSGERGGAPDGRVAASLGRVDALGGSTEVTTEGTLRQVTGRVPLPAPG
jgi:signal transduction histidine kinase